MRLFFGTLMCLLLGVSSAMAEPSFDWADYTWLLWPILSIVGIVWFASRYKWTTLALLVIVAVLIAPVTPGYWLSQALYHEARGEDWLGQRAVVSVIFNRQGSRLFPNTIEEVVTDGTERGVSCDFSFYCDGKSDHTWFFSSKYWKIWLWTLVKSHVATGLNAIGLWPDPTGGALYYKRTDVQSPWFAKQIEAGKMTRVLGDFGRHEFFR